MPYYRGWIDTVTVPLFELYLLQITYFFLLFRVYFQKLNANTYPKKDIKFVVNRSECLP